MTQQNVGSGDVAIGETCEGSGAYKIKDPNWSLSPHTGMTREHWIDASLFLLRGVFQHVKSLDDPIVMPKQNQVSYPQPDDPKHRFQASEFEGLSRTFMAAAGVINEYPDIACNGLCLRQYYAHQILESTDPKSPRYWGKISDFTKDSGRMQYQQTVEGAALVISLMSTREQIWDRYTPEEKEQVASLISDYAHSLTIGHNWRFFNVLMLTFLKINGFEIDEQALKDHLQHLTSCYAGDGWYVDDTNFDLYNPWGFHFYGPIWCSWYGYEHEPELAQIIEERNRTFIKNWPRFFSRDAKQLMWGRSIIYRFAASAAFGAHFLMKDPVLDPGFSRRIASGNMLQFLTRKDLFVNGLPCLGYYGPFEPLIQFYSCATSPFWVAKIFVALSLEKDSPFWTAKENEGFWPALGDEVQTTNLPGPGMQVVNHGKTGCSELRTAKVILQDTYYIQLQFNPHFCLESESPGGSNAANYSIRERNMGHDFRIPKDIAFIKFDSGLLYRQQNTQPKGLGNPNLGGVNRGPERIDLVDIIVPSGVLRVDRVRVPYAYELQLGHFALPHLGGESADVRPLGRGLVASIPDGRKVAMVPIMGWDTIRHELHKGLNPEAEESTVIFTERIREKDYSGMEVFVTLLLHRVDGEDWSEEELDPIKELEVLDWAPSGTACGVRLLLKTGQEYLIDYGAVDGCRII